MHLNKQNGKSENQKIKNGVQVPSGSATDDLFDWRLTKQRHFGNELRRRVTYLVSQPINWLQKSNARRLV